jgi:hypothetical protein
MDIVTLVNLILAIIICVLGFWAYGKKKGFVPLYLATAFLLFAITHLITLIGLAASLTIVLIIIRIIAYVIIIGALYRILAKN